VALHANDTLVFSETVEGLAVTLETESGLDTCWVTTTVAVTSVLYPCSVTVYVPALPYENVVEGCPVPEPGEPPPKSHEMLGG
jgi:hypothetical protein